MTLYFGPEFARKEWETQVPTPVGKPCLHCTEAIAENDIGTITSLVELVDGKPAASLWPIHYECSMRQVIGSAAHVKGVCSCNIPGSQEGDDPELSVREAAVAALREWNRRN